MEAVYPRVWGDDYSGRKVCVDVAAAEVGRLPSCYKEKLCAAGSGCEVGSLEVSSSEKKNSSAHILQYYGLYLNHPEKKTVHCCCCGRGADVVLFLLFRLNP